MKNRNDVLTSESPEQLVSNLRTLLSEAERMVGNSAGEPAADKIEELRAGIANAQARIQELYGTAREKITTGAKHADEAIRSHPYESLAVALGVGVLLGALLRRGN